MRSQTSGSQPTCIVSPSGVGSAERPHPALLLQPVRRLWSHLERTRKSLGACSFGFFAFSLVSVVAPGAQAFDLAPASNQECCPDAAVPCAPDSLPEAVHRIGALEATEAASSASAQASAAPPAPVTPAPAVVPAAPPAPAAAVVAQARPAAARPPAPVPTPKLGFDRSLGVPRTPYGKQIYRVALRYALNPLFVAAVVEAESDFNPRAVSRKGACGLMQVLPATARRFGLHRRRDLFNPLKNLETGARYLRWLADRFGDDAMRVLAAYNAGEGSVERFGGLPPFRETRGYVQGIFARLGFTLLLPTVPAAALPAVPAADLPVAAFAGTR